ncbi:MAG: hypothetical protein H2045_09970 [Rhizobiales bacterium]|nr:hypothetical protein [Hyphomicrobiales bacterium]
MTAQLFLAYVGVIAALSIGIAWRYLPGRAATAITIGLPLWLGYVATLSWFEVLKTVPGRPPGILLVFAPIILFIALVVIRSRWGRIAALAIPIALLHGLQVFRIGIELFLHRFWEMGLAPRMLTYEGANVDILVALSAPFVAFIATRGSVGLRVALAWNVVGLLALANVIVRSVLTAPGPLNILASDVPNLFVSTFPYSLLPGFFPPLAITLHILSIKAIRVRLRDGHTQQDQRADRSLHARHRS